MIDQKLANLRHSCAHLLAASVLDLFPTAKLAIGPSIEDGFYYDIDFGEQKITNEDLSKLEKTMKGKVKSWNSFQRIDKSKKEALEYFKDNPYKSELINELSAKGENITFYRSGEFVDLCRGGHSESPSKDLKYFKLLSIAGAYWRGSEKNPMLTRIYGTCFFNKEDLDNHLKTIEEAKKRDHRKLGKELDLFVISENIGKGLPLLTPKGALIRKQILDYEYQLEVENGFQQVFTPHIARSEMYKKTGHWQHYRDVMYAPFGIDGEEYVLKPMNCPHHYMIYSSRPRSYKELPIRLSEAGTCYRFEKTGELAGLLRVRALSIDDSHILMTEDQIEDEFRRCIDMVKKMFKAFKLHNFYVRLSLSDPSDAVKYIADEDTWKKAGEKLEKIIKDNNLEYKVGKGEASFYGPKIDFIVRDSLNREWQMSTLQLDLFMAKRLNLTYIDEDGKEKHPVILHRGLTGSIERTLAILIEHFAGAFPLWLAPVQVSILPLSEKFADYAEKVKKELLLKGIRTEQNNENKTLGLKIREATLHKIPYLIIIGEKEVDSHSISVRSREGKNLGQLKVSEFITQLKTQIENFS